MDQKKVRTKRTTRHLDNAFEKIAKDIEAAHARFFQKRGMNPRTVNQYHKKHYDNPDNIRG